MNKRLIFLPLFFFVCHILLANPSKIIHLDSSRFPEIEELKSTDILFKEFCFIVEDNYKLIAIGYRKAFAKKRLPFRQASFRKWLPCHKFYFLTYQNKNL